ncbi:MAG: DUF4157 domain-containing protein [Bacteroidia bacterium]
MYAPRQYRPEKKKPFSNFLALEQPEYEGPIMAPPVYSATGEGLKKEEEDKEDAGKKAKSSEVQPGTEQTAVQNNRNQSESQGAESESASTEAPAQRKEIGRSEQPPQFKLKASSPRQFKFADSPVQMKAGSGSGSGSGGESAGVMQKMGAAMGADFSNVNIHQNSQKATEAGALAYAQGNDVHFAPGQFSPNTPGGQQLIGHELAHVVQQRQGRVQANAEVNGMAANTDHSLEAEADAMGAKAAAFDGPAAAPVVGAGGGGGAAQMKMDPNATDKNPDQQEESKKENQEDREDDQRSEADDAYGTLDALLALDGFNKRPDKEDEEKEGENEKGDKEKQEAAAKGDTPENTEVESPEDEAEDKENAEGGPAAESESAESEADGQEGEDQADKSKDELEDKASEAEQEEPESEEAEAVKDDVEGKDQQEDAAAKEEGGDTGAAEEAGAAGAESAASADAGGGDTGADAGGGADAQAGGGSGGDAPIEVRDAQRGNFGEGDEPDLMVVNEAGSKEFDAQRIIKKNPDGTFIVVSGTPSVSDPSSTGLPVQMAGDKDKPIKKKLSKSQSSEMFAANREKVSSYLNEFESQARSKISALESAKSSIAGQVNAGASAAKSVVLSAAAAEKSRIEGAFEAQKSALLAESESIKAAVQAQMQSSSALISVAAQTARTNVEAEYTAQDAAFVALEPAQKAKFTAAFDKGKEDMVKAAEELGKLAIDQGEKRAAEYEAMPIPEQSWDEDLLNGGDYEKDRHNARVKAARDVAKSYADQFMQKAQEEGAKLKGSGETELHQYVTDSVKASRDAISQRKQSALDQITAQEQGAIQALQTACEATISGVTSATDSGIASLDQQKAQAIGQVETTAQAKVQAIDTVAAEKITNLESQLQTSIDALNNQVNMTVTGVSSRKNPNAEAVHQQLQQALAGIESGVQTSMQTIDSGITASIQGADDIAQETATELNTAATAAIDGGEQMKTEVIAGLQAQQESYTTSAGNIVDQTSTGMTQGAEQAAKDMQDQYKAVSDDFDGALGKLEGKMTENSAAFRGNIQEQLNGLDAKITEEAQKAYDAVQPRWVSWLLTAIDILVMIIITAVVLVAVASGVGILGLLLIGAVAGAIGGAIKYGARCALTSEEFTLKGLATEMVNGAVDGLNIAVGMIPGVGVLAQVGMGALGGAIKYGADCLINGKEFSWSALGGKVFLGGLEGLMGAIGGKAGDGVENFLTKKIGETAMEKLGNKIIVDVAKTGTEAMFDTVNGGLQNMFESYFETGTLDFSKFTEKITLTEFATNFATSKVTDFAAGKMSDGVVDHYGLNKDSWGNFLNGNSNKSNSGDGSGSGSGSGSNTTTTTSQNGNGGDGNNQSTTVGGNGNNQTTTVGGDGNNNQSTHVGGDGNNQTTQVGDGNTHANENTTTSGDGNNKDSNTDPANQGGNTPVLVPPVNNNTTTNADANPTPDPSKTKGQQQAEAKGYPDAPKGYEWVAKSDGSPYLRRQSGNADSLPQVKYDPATKQFVPTKSAPDGYHWKYQNGEFSVHPDAAHADSLPPMQYDPTTGGFKTADGPYNGDITTLPVRGQDFDGFVKTVNDPKFDAETQKQAYELFAKKDWAGLEKMFNEKGLNGGWPPNRGFIDIKPGVLKAGDSFDRFGGRLDADGNFVDSGRFVAPYGADFGGRALPQSKLDGDPSTGKKPDTLKGYKIVKDIPVLEGDAIPWFGQPGGGKQYELPEGGIDKLIKDGYIVEIDAPDLKITSGDGNKTGDVTTGSDGSTTPTTDGGGGMRSKTNDGRDVYSPDSGQKIKDLKSTAKDPSFTEKAQVRDAFLSSIGGEKLRHGATLTASNTSPNKATMVVNGIEVEVTIYPSRNKDFASANHGANQGPAKCSVTFDPATGKWSATINVNENYNSADLNKMAVHELNEVSSIVVAENRNVASGKYDDPSGGIDPTKVNQAIAGQQEAKVFKEGVAPGDVDVKNMSAHDHAVVREVDLVMRELAADLSDPTKDPTRNQERLKALMETMGIKYTGDPGFKLLVDNLGLKIPTDVQNWIDRSIGKDQADQHIVNAMTHVEVAEGRGPNGIIGCHNRTNFLAHPDVQVVNKKYSKTKGVVTYEYHMRKADGSGGFVGDPTPQVFIKTTYDPKVWPYDKLKASINEAWNGGTPTDKSKNGKRTRKAKIDNSKRTWQGYDSAGNRISGYFEGTAPNLVLKTFWFGDLP